MAAVSGSDKSAAMYSLKASSYSCSADLLNLLSGIDIFGKLGSKMNCFLSVVYISSFINFIHLYTTML